MTTAAPRAVAPRATTARAFALWSPVWGTALREVFFAAGFSVEGFSVEGFSAGAAISWVFVMTSPKLQVARGRYCAGWYHVRVKQTCRRSLAPAEIVARGNNEAYRVHTH